MNSIVKKIFLLFVIVCVCALVLILAIKNNREQIKGKYIVVASFAPVYVATLNICDGISGVQVECMAPSNVGCLHDYVLTPRDVMLIENANLFISNGLGMEESLTDASMQREGLAKIDASYNIQGKKEEDEYNAHVYASILKYMEQVKNIASGLARVDENNAEKYMSNMNLYLDNLQREYEDGKNILAEYKKIKVATIHDSFVYIADDFDIQISAHMDVHEDVEPSTEEIIEFVENIKKENIKYIFIGEDTSEKLAQMLSKETGAKVVVFNTFVQGVNQDSYITSFRENVQVLKNAFGGEANAR